MIVHTDFLDCFALILVPANNLERCFRVVNILAAGTLGFAGPGRILVSSSVLMVRAGVIYYLARGNSEGLSRVLQTVSRLLHESPCSPSVPTPWESIKVPIGTA
jgi:hypothetical protein